MAKLRDQVKYSKDPDFVLKHAEAHIDNPWTNREVGVAAIRRRKLDIFKRAFAVNHGEENFVLWESSAHELYKAGDVEGAHLIYSAIIEMPAAGERAWHGWLATLGANKPDAERLAKAATYAPKYPVIFHESACVYVKLGDKPRALANVEAAVQYVYGDLERMKTDDDLAPLRKEKRFAAAFTAKPRPFDLAELEQTMTIYKKPRLVMRPVLGMFFYFAMPIAKLGPLVAAAIEQYLQQIEPVKLTHYKSGHWKALKKGGLSQQLGKLKKVRAGYIYVDVAMRDVDGDATDFSFSAELRNESDQASELKLTYPRTIDPDVAYERFRDFAKLLPAESGSCGLTIAERDDCAVYEGVSWDSEPDYARCLGFERHPMREWNRGTAGAHWLTLLGDKLVAKLGGVAALKKSIGAAKLAAVGDAVIIRAAQRPPIGLATNPADIGALPTVAKAIAKLRSNGKVKSEVSYARFDDLSPTAYENGPA